MSSQTDDIGKKGPNNFVEQSIVVEHWLEQDIFNWSTMKDWSNDPLHHEQTLLP